MSTRAELLRAWHEWDAKADRPSRALPMEVACTSYAHQLGMTTTQFRHELAAARRSGLSREAALAELEGPL